MSPVLEIVFEIRLQMLLGMAVYPALERILEHRKDDFSKNLGIWIKKRVAGQENEKIFSQHPLLTNTSGKRALLLVLEQGLMKGSPIDKSLQELQEEFMYKVESNFERKLQILPLKLLVPLTLLVLPGVMALIVGPILISLMGKI